MPQLVATVVYALVILTLVLLDHDRKSRVSPALWIPVAWVSIGASRAVSQWFGVTPGTGSAEQYLEGSPFDRFILTGLLAAGLIVLLARGRRAGTFLRANGPILLFFLYCAVSVLWSDYSEVAFKRWTRAAGDVVMVLVVLTDTDPSAAVKRLLARTAFLLIPVSVLLIKYYPDLARGYTHEFWTGTWTPYVTGIATGKNSLGYVCLVFGLASLWRAFEAMRAEEGACRWPLIAHTTVVAMAMWLFWKADSATSLACFLIGGSLIAIMSLPGLAQKPAVVHLAMGAGLLLSLSTLLLNTGTGLVEAMGRDTTLTGRTALWDHALSMTVDPLFGAGFESFWLGERLEEIWRIYMWHPNQAHNGYLEVFLNLGLTGVALLGLVMIWGYRNLLGALRSDPEAGRLRLAYFAVAAVYNLTEAAIKATHPVWLAFLLAVMVVPEPSSPEDE